MDRWEWSGFMQAKSKAAGAGAQLRFVSIGQAEVPRHNCPPHSGAGPGRPITTSGSSQRSPCVPRPSRCIRNPLNRDLGESDPSALAGHNARGRAPGGRQTPARSDFSAAHCCQAGAPCRRRVAGFYAAPLPCPSGTCPVFSCGGGGGGGTMGSCGGRRRLIELRGARRSQTAGLVTTRHPGPPPTAYVCRPGAVCTTSRSPRRP